MQRLIERLLPWFDPVREAERDRHTERIRIRSIGARIRAERALASYRAAEDRRVRH